MKLKTLSTTRTILQKKTNKLFGAPQNEPVPVLNGFTCPNALSQTEEVGARPMLGAEADPDSLVCPAL